MERIAIIGSSGAGKSTLARRLGEQTGLPVYHLDVLHWKPNWVLISKEDQRVIQKVLVKRPEWIIDGNYGGTLDIRIEAADTVIFLDFKRTLCLYRVMKRAFQYRNKRRPDMHEGNREHIDLAFYRWIWRFPLDQRPIIIDQLEQLSDETEVIWLRTPKDVEDFLNRVKEKDECDESMEH
ncbi:Adenylate kinase [Alkalibacterium subtropicum]|uniref:Adenylate kinase n=1 Tax=Alkalibacterium subtropicum TaxID=753702 RepID=A0A1I1FJP5_9LACT|nr:Adenylate kinase [Alkalibacterium subtropicum]